MALGPDPFGLVTRYLLIQRHPQVLIHHRLLRRRHPAFPLPAVNPGGDPVLHVLRIGDHLHLAAHFQRAQTLDGRGQLHAIIRGVRRTTPQLFVMVAMAQDGRPTARTGIAEAGSVSNDLDFLQGANTGSDWKKPSTMSRIWA